MGELAKQMAEKMGEKYEPIEDRRPTEPAIIVGVRLEGTGIEQSTFAAGDAIAASWAGGDASAPKRETPPPPERWDRSGRRSPSDSRATAVAWGTWM